MERLRLVPSRLAALTLLGSISLQLPVARMSGAVVSGDGTPVDHAIVIASAAGADSRGTLTNEHGSFEFDRLPPGTYWITARKAGFSLVESGATGTSGQTQPVTLAAGDHRTGLVIRLRRGAVISGTIWTTDGEPAPSVFVQLAPDMGVPAVLTDVDGRYRFYAVPPGTYAVRASMDRPMRPGTKVMLATSAPTLTGVGGHAGVAEAAAVFTDVFYPGVTSEDRAERVVVRAGEERAGVDFWLTLAGSRSISGTLRGIDGQPASEIAIRVGRRPGARPEASVKSGPDGEFRIGSIAPGRYHIWAAAHTIPSSAGVSKEELLWGERAVDVTHSDAAGVEVQLQPTTRVTGSVEHTTRADFARIVNLKVSLVRVDGLRLVTPVQDDGAFLLEGVPSGSYRVEVLGLPNGSRLQAATWNGVDLVASGLSLAVANAVRDVRLTIGDARLR